MKNPSFYPDFSSFHPISKGPSLAKGKPLLLLGSCFSQEIGIKAENIGLVCRFNPWGTFYNPVTVREFLEILLGITPFSPQESFQHLGLWRHPLVHSSLACSQRDELEKGIQQRLEEFKKQLIPGSVLVITFGTGHIWTHSESSRIYGNCHKLPSRLFRRELMDLESETQNWLELIKVFSHNFPGTKLVFSLSPVKYFQSGMEENTLTKSILRLLIYQLQEGTESLYFPSYEMLTDLLRDYRFYGPDGRHPGPLATKWIWEEFLDWLCDFEVLDYCKEASKLRKMLEHRILHPGSPQAEIYRSKLEEKLGEFMNKYPWSELSRPEEKVF